MNTLPHLADRFVDWLGHKHPALCAATTIAAIAACILAAFAA